MNAQMERKLLATRFGYVHYWSIGSGPTVLLLHQAAQSSDEYRAFAPLLADKYRVVSLDYPGHGGSDTPDHELTVPEYCEAVMMVLDDAAVDRAHVVGHHSGGILAVSLANANPQRFDRLVLSGAGISDPAVADLLLNNPMTRDLPLDADGDFLQKTWAVYRKMSAPNASPDESFLSFIVGLKARLRPYDMHYELVRWEYESEWRQLRHATLLIKAEHDHFSGDVAGLNEALPNSRMIEIPDCGPWLFNEQPGAIASAVEDFFLEDAVET